MRNAYALIFLSLFVLLNFSCKKEEVIVEKENSSKITIKLSKDDDQNIVIKEKISYNEEEMKEVALSSLVEFLSLPYDAQGVSTAYEQFYSENYKAILARERGIKNVEEYVLSEPSLDFEFEAEVSKVNNIWFEGSKVYIDVESSIYDRLIGSKTKLNQVFTMTYENNKWVVN